MSEYSFKNVLKKFQHYVIYDIEQQFYKNDEYQEGNKKVYSFIKDCQFDQLPRNIQTQISQKYLSDFQKDSFDEWWKKNGDDYQKEHEQYGDDALCIAFEQYLEQNGQMIMDQFERFNSMTQFLKIEVEDQGNGNVSFYFETHYKFNKIDLTSESYNDETVISIQLLNDRMLEALNKKIMLEFPIPKNQGLQLQLKDFDDIKIGRELRRIARQFEQLI